MKSNTTKAMTLLDRLGPLTIAKMAMGGKTSVDKIIEFQCTEYSDTIMQWLMLPLLQR